MAGDDIYERYKLSDILLLFSHASFVIIFKKLKYFLYLLALYIINHGENSKSYGWRNDECTHTLLASYARSIYSYILRSTSSIYNMIVLASGWSNRNGDRLWLVWQIMTDYGIRYNRLCYEILMKFYLVSNQIRNWRTCEISPCIVIHTYKASHYLLSLLYIVRISHMTYSAYFPHHTPVSSPWLIITLWLCHQ